MSVARRQMLTQEGEALLLCNSVHSLAQRFGDFADTFGVPDSAVISDAVVSIPLPNYEQIPTGLRRWADTKAEVMWHPLMWLPDRLAFRKTLTFDERMIVEPVQIWAIRVCLELTASGLYDPTTGTWMDVLSAFDIDTTDPSGYVRAQRWLNGNEDEILDSIDMDKVLLNEEDPDWAFDVAVDIAQECQYASWALMANDMLSMADYLADGRVDTHDGAVSVMSTIANNAIDTLRSVPSSSPTANTEFWTAVSAGVKSSTSLDDILLSVFVPVEEYLTNVRDQYWPHWENIPNVLGVSEDPGFSDSLPSRLEDTDLVSAEKSTERQA